MSELKNKIDFAVIIEAHHTNPNGDPLNENRPRTSYDNLGEISDVCLKRKIRNRLQDMGEKIFIQMDERVDDGCKSLAERVKLNGLDKLGKKEKDKYIVEACNKWLDVRAFGQVFAFKGDSMSVGVRGAASITSALSITRPEIESLQITKSTNSAEEKDGGKAKDTMGEKHRIAHGLYIAYGSIFPEQAYKNGLTKEDVDKIKSALMTLFENDSSAARPSGSLYVSKVIWWKHNSKLGQYASHKVFQTLKIEPNTKDPKFINDYDISISELPGLAPEIINC